MKKEFRGADGRNSRNSNYRMSNHAVLFGIMLFCGIAVSYSNPVGAKAGKAEAPASVLRATLKNGLRVVIVKNSLAQVVTTEINYLVGSDEAPEGFPGTAHALEHMMFRGSPGLSASQLADISAAMGGDNDAQTRQMITQYFFTVPSEDLDVALRIEAIRMKEVLCTDSLWDKERGAIEQEVAQDLSNPTYVFLTKLYEIMFHGTPYAHDALGTRVSFDSTTAAMLRAFHETWYAPNNAVLVVVGDVDPQKTLTEVQELFDGIPSGKLPPRPTFKFAQVKSDTLTMPTDLSYGLAVIAYRFPGSGSPDYAAAQVLSDVLSNQRGKLYALVPEGKALSADFEYYPLSESGVGFVVAAFPKGFDSNTLVKELRGILSQELKDGVSADLVEAARRHKISEEEFEKNSISGLASEWSDAVAIEGRQSPDEDLEAIEKVSVADVNRVARAFIDSSRALTAVLTPQSSGKQISSNSFGGAESFATKETKGVALPAWAQSAVGRLSVPHSTTNPTVTVLPNGIKLIVQPESISNTISVIGHIKDNPQLQQPAHQDGAAEILNQLFEYGSTTRDRIALLKALDDIGADESAGSSFSIQVLRKDFSRGVELLADNELNPALPETAFKVIQQQTSATVAGQLESPDYLTKRAIHLALLPKADPALRETTPATVDSLNLGDEKTYYDKVFRPDMTTIVVIGNVLPDTAKKIIWNYFKGWKASGPKPETDLPTVPLNKPSNVVVPDVSRVQDKVYLSEMLGITRSNPDYYTLQLGNQILGGANFAARFYLDLRENAGLVYYVGSVFEISKTRGEFQVSYACDPGNVAKARTIIVRDLKQMGDSEVTMKELTQAKALLLREIPLSESSESSIAHGMLGRAVEDLPLDEPILAAQRYLKLDAKDIKAAYAKWIRPDDLVQVIEGPTPK